MAESSINKILWDENRRLNWNDFQSTNFVGPSDFTALSKIGINVTHEAELISTEPCQFVFTSIVGRGSFHMSESWVKEIGRNEGGLRHEQGHFDIGEIFARKFNELAKEFLMNKNHTCAEINGKSAEERKKIGAYMMICDIYDTIYKKYLKMQEMYETQTDNGRSVLNQPEWERIISTMLNDLEAHRAA